MPIAVENLLHHPSLWRGGDPVRAERPGIPTGFSVLDDALPGGGWPTAGLGELLVAQTGIGEIRLLLPALARLTATGRPVVWVAPPHLPYAPALAGGGFDPARTLVVRPGNPRDALWAAEAALRSGACGAVLVWLQKSDFTALRRLQLAAQGGEAWGVIFRPAGEAVLSSPAPLRLLLEPAGEDLAVRVLKRRGSPLVAPLNLRFGDHSPHATEVRAASPGQRVFSLA